MGLIPEHCNKVNITIQRVIIFLLGEVLAFNWGKKKQHLLSTIKWSTQKWGMPVHGTIFISRLQSRTCLGYSHIMLLTWRGPNTDAKSWTMPVQSVGLCKLWPLPTSSVLFPPTLFFHSWHWATWAFQFDEQAYLILYCLNILLHCYLIKWFCYLVKYWDLTVVFRRKKFSFSLHL